MILRSEDFYEDAPATVVGRTLEFLGLPIASMEGYATYNAGSYAEPMDAALSGRLMEYFRPHNRSLYVYLDRYFSWGW